MAQTDTSIYGNLLRPAKSLQEYSNDMDAADLQRTQLAAGKLNLIGAQQAQADQQAVRALYQRPGFDPTSEEGLSALSAASPSTAMAARKAILENKETQAKITRAQGLAPDQVATTAETVQKTEASKYDLLAKRKNDHLKELVTVGDVPSAVGWINDAVKSGELPGDRAQQVIAALQSGQISLPEWKQKAMLGGLSSQEQLTLQQKQKEADETARHNKSTEGIAAGQLGVAQGNLGVARQRLALDQSAPKGQIVQTDQGTMLVDPRASTATPVIGPGGVPLTRPLKDIPGSVNTAIIANAQSLNRVNQAIDLLSGKDVGALKGDKAATGWKGYLPQAALNRWDPSGVDARAMASDIGSLILHDRSGAAVTAAESPRLMPFIPQATDDNPTILKKLTRFKQAYEQEQQAFAEAYGKDQGYRPSPVKPAESTAKSSGGGLSPEAIAAELKRRGQ